MNRIASLALTVLLGLVVSLVLPAGAAHAAAYRYWGYFQWDGSSWQFATKGPDQVKPADGSVEGWRFATATPDSTRVPRVEVSFDEVCADTEAADGKKRVAVVLDHGRTADNEDGSTPPEPVAHCASVDEAATGLEVLGAVTDVRTEGGLVCGIDGYPAAGCGGEVEEVTAEASAPDTPVELAQEDDATGAQGAAGSPDAEEEDGMSTGSWIGIAVALLVAIGLGGAALRRRGEG